jgi:hypothetical protein
VVDAGVLAVSVAALVLASRSRTIRERVSPGSAAPKRRIWAVPSRR